MVKLFEGKQPHPVESVPARFPEGRVGYAVGDVHGNLDLLEEMLHSIEANAAATGARDPVVLFLGDYVDRGPDSRGVLDRLRAWSPPFERRFLMGNHEQALLAFLRDPKAGAAWLDHGGLATLASFEVRPPVRGEINDVERVAGDLSAALGGERLAFLRALESHAVYGGYCFVHAGVDDAKELKEQTEREFYWARARFLRSSRRWTHIVVHGHTPVEAPYRDHRRIAVDTGAYATGRLSAVRLEGENVAFLEVRRAGRRGR